MFNQKLVASIKANGKILREFKDTVYIPFSSEYSILLKNLDTRRVLLNIYIDGDNITPNGFVLYGGQEVDLERSLKNNNLTEGNKFKFIERTNRVEQHRGIKLEDGLIRIEYQFEHIYPITTITSTWGTGDYMPGELRGVTYSATTGTVPTAIQCMAVTNNISVNSSITATSHTVNDIGITVPGSHSNQKFNTASYFSTEVTKHSIVLKLLGETPDNKPVEKPVTVKSKPKCVTCGKQNKATAKFCTECGTALSIAA